MENGIDNVQLEENKNVENGFEVEKRALGESSGLNDALEEVFEEAVDSPEKLQDIGMNSESSAGVELSMETVLAALEDNLDEVSEVGSFKEATDISGEEVVVDDEEKVEVYAGDESIDKIDEGGTGKHWWRHGEKESAKEVVTDGYIEEEETEIGVSDEVQVLSGGDEVKSEKDVALKHEVLSHVKNEESRDDELGFSAELDNNNGEVLNKDDADKTNVEHLGEESGSSKADTNGLNFSGEVCGGEKVMGSVESVHRVQQDERNEGKEEAIKEDSESQEDTPVLEAASVVPHVPGGKETVTSEPMSSPPLEKPVNEVTGTQESYVESKGDKDSEPQSADKQYNGVGSNNKNEKVEKKPEEKGQGEKQSSQVNREGEIEMKPTSQSVKPSITPTTSTSTATTSTLPSRPAGLGRAAPLLEPAPRAVQQPRVNGTVSHTQSQQVEDNNGDEENDETREKLQMIRVKFLRLARRLGQTPHNVVVAQVLYRLGLAEQLRGRNGSRVGAFSFDRASAMAEQLEAAGQEPLDFSCTIMVLGKTGVGKSATINSIFDEVKFPTDAFQVGTKKVQDVVGTVQGIKVRVIDTPGLLTSCSDQRQNEKILQSAKRFIKKSAPDIVLYLDRLDMQSRDSGDMPLLRTITEIFGPSIWFNAIVVLTHAASAPPEGPNGTASSYDMFVTQRSHVVQQAIRQAAGDMRLMNPVSLVENHSACRTNRAGQRVLPNGQVWKPHLLLLSFASKILAEANALLKLQDSPLEKTFATRTRAPPLPFLMSSLLQSRPQVKLPEEQFGDEDDLEYDLDESSDSDGDSELEDLPPFKTLTNSQLAKLSKAQKKAYYDELEYREKLFMKKQLKEERRRRRMMKKMAAAAKNASSDYAENLEEESGGAASIPVPMPDLALPASFDSDNPTHRYRSLDTNNQWLVRPVLETHGWDHDVGYEGINVERLFVVKEKLPISFSGQVTKDKKDANVQMELASSIKHGEGKATSLGFDMQTVGKDLAYTLRGETRFSNFRKNKATAGVSVTALGDTLSGGVKVEDKLILNKRFRMVVSGGAMTGRGDVAYGGSLEAQLRDKDYPLGRSLSTLGLSVMDWHGDLAVGCNIQTQVPIGRSTNMIARANLNNRGAGQISIRVNSSEQLQLALIGIIPLLKKLFAYPHQMQYGQ